MDQKDEIKQKIDIVDLIRDYIQVMPAGSNFRAKCPFHREKTPSFMISPDKQIYHCFGCGKGGDVFEFVKEMEGVDFVGAMKILAPKAGVVLKKFDPQKASEKERSLEIMEMCRRYYHRVLLESGEASSALAYLGGRGLEKSSLGEWQIGFSPGAAWDTVYRALRQKGFTDKEVLSSGMCIRHEQRGTFFDRFRGRIMFPINDVNGQTIAFTARVSPDKEETEQMGKYINSPQTFLYDKGKVLFALDKARLEIKAQDRAIIVEGQMDAITAHENGFGNVVASSGTALTRDQVALVKRYSKNICIAFDADDAGIQAAERGIREAVIAGLNITIAEISEGKDPDECIRKDPGLFRKSLDGALPVMEYFFKKALGGLDPRDVNSLNRAQSLVLPVISIIPNRIEQDFWIGRLAESLGASKQVIIDELKKVKARPAPNAPVAVPRKEPAPEESASRLSPDENLGCLALALVLKFGELIEYAVQNLQIEQLSGEKNTAIYKSLINYYNNYISNSADGLREFTPGHFSEWLKKEDDNIINEKEINQSDYVDRLVLLADKEYLNLDYTGAKNELIRLILELKKRYVKARMKEVEVMIKEAEEEKDDILADEMMAEYRSFAEELFDLQNNN